MKILTLALSTLLISSIACFAENNERKESQAFKVGTTLPLTGAFAEYGEAIHNGMQLAIEQQAKSSKQISFIFEDDSYQPKKGLIAFDKLRTQDNVDLIFAWGIEPVRAVGVAAERAKFPVIAGSLDPRASQKRKYVIGAFSPYKTYSCDLMKEMSAQALLKLGYIKSEVSLFEGLLEAAKQCLQPGQTIAEINHFIPSDNDFKAAIAKMKRMDLDAFGIYLTTPQLLTFFKQAQTQKFRTTYFGPTLFYDRQLIENFPDLLSGAYLTHNIASLEFTQKYIAKFNNDTHLGYAAHAYEIANMLIEKFYNKSNLPVNDILQILTHDTAPRESAAGRYNITKHKQGGHYFSFPPGVYQISHSGTYQLKN